MIACSHGASSVLLLPRGVRRALDAMQRVSILAQAVGRLLVFQRVAFDEGVERQLSSDLGFGHPDLLQRAFGFGLLALRCGHVRGLVHPAALLARFPNGGIRWRACNTRTVVRLDGCLARSSIARKPNPREPDRPRYNYNSMISN